LLSVKLGFVKSQPDQEATVLGLHHETAALTPSLTPERLEALQRIIPRAQIDAVLAQTGHDRASCRRLPAWFMVRPPDLRDYVLTSVFVKARLGAMDFR
jgi:hypothetical protein